jgi:hypothetical protein
VAADGLNSGIRGLCLRQSRNEVVEKIVARLKNDVSALRREWAGKNQKSPESSADRPSRTKATEPANPKSRRFCPMCKFITANDMAKSATGTIVYENSSSAFESIFGTLCRQVQCIIP